jgi:hypothetical protein
LAESAYDPRMTFRDSLRKLLDSVARPRRLVRPTNPLGDYRPTGGVLSPGYERALEDELKSVVPEDLQVPDDERGMPGLRDAFKQGEESKDT